MEATREVIKYEYGPEITLVKNSPFVEIHLNYPVQDFSKEKYLDMLADLALLKEELKEEGFSWLMTKTKDAKKRRLLKAFGFEIVTLAGDPRFYGRMSLWE